MVTNIQLACLRHFNTTHKRSTIYETFMNKITLDKTILEKKILNKTILDETIHDIFQNFKKNYKTQLCTELVLVICCLLSWSVWKLNILHIFRFFQDEWRVPISENNFACYYCSWSLLYTACSWTNCMTNMDVTLPTCLHIQLLFNQFKQKMFWK